jgi:type I restriction enzyme, S subunit
MTGKNKLRLGDIFHKRTRPGRDGLPIFSVTLNDGLIARNSLDRQFSTDLSLSEHLLVQKDDLVYNMMRMWQGASGVAQEDCVVSPAYVVLEADPRRVDPTFASFLFKTRKMLSQFRAQSYGLTDDRLRLYYKDFSQILVALPSIEYQGHVASILRSLTEAIAIYPDLMKAKLRMKRYLTDSILGASVASQGEAKGKPFGDLIKISHERFDPSKDMDRPLCVELDDIAGDLGKLNGPARPAAELSSSKVRFRKGDVLYGKLRPYLRKFLLPEFDGVCSGEIWVLRPSSLIAPEFLFHLVQSTTFSRAANVSSGSKMPRAEWGVASRVRILLPSVETQRLMISPLTTLDEEITCLRDMFEILKSLKSSILSACVEGSVKIIPGAAA